MVDALHINDNNLILDSAGQRAVSQGYAWLKGDQVLFDLGGTDSPVSHCRLAPQQMNNRYWQQCEQSAIPANGAGMRHAADLVWQHLNQLREQKNLTELVLVVPSHYRESNLQLLLGIAKASQLQIKGLVNKAVVALHNRVQADDEHWHFDVQLHQTVCSRIKVENGLVSLGEIEVLSDVGIHLMQEALLKGLQNNFIQNDRFDPLHDAATEQQLFDQLPNVAMQLADSGKASVSLQHHNRLHNTTLDSKEWQALLMPFSDRLLTLSGSAKRSYVDFNAAFGTAGLDSLAQAGFIQIHETQSASLSDVAQAQNSGSIVYRTDLPLARSKPSTSGKDKTGNARAGGSKQEDHQANSTAISSPNTSPQNADTALQQATHLLCGGKAMPIINARLTTDNGVLGLQQSSSGNIDELLSSGRLFILNDEGRTQLKINDRIGSNLADGVLTVIQVL
ncbi:MAG: hypothetical protein ACI9SP_002595 [Arenicella sp.]|jgi:hypothetical protein